MTERPLRFVFIGLSITSAWGNGHATTYRSLIRGLSRCGHDVLFLEREVPWYAGNRDMAAPPFCQLSLYQDLAELKRRHEGDVRDADVVIVGSYVPEGVAVGDWVIRTARGVTAFYDIDTPVTLAKLAGGDFEYLAPALISRYQLYLSFTGGPMLERIEQEYGAQRALPLYCSFDPDLYHPLPGTVADGQEPGWDLGYMGTWSDDRQPTLDRLLTKPARQWGGGRFVVAGPLYPDGMRWPPNVQRIDHVSPDRHPTFYCRQRFTLNVTRSAMIAAGYSPSVRLFEAAACGTPIITDWWEGLDTVFRVGSEVLVPRSSRDVLDWLVDMPGTQGREVGERARRRVLAEHTAVRRASQLEGYARTALRMKPAA
ncbi:MAG TPA: glycosyltransferase [Longimicrobiales bacterium]|nr:glycosyltransferase [Longimicrobiales bacterium]